jgi:large subunit ribosomal protein L44e
MPSAVEYVQKIMQLPKETNRYCPKCKKHTKHKIGTAKQKSRSATRPLSRGSSAREKLRGLRGGTGNLGRRSKKGPKDWKRKTKTTKRITVTYKCSKCNKIKGIKKAIRSGRIMIGETVAK